MELENESVKIINDNEEQRPNRKKAYVRILQLFLLSLLIVSLVLEATVLGLFANALRQSEDLLVSGLSPTEYNELSADSRPICVLFVYRSQDQVLFGRYRFPTLHTDINGISCYISIAGAFVAKLGLVCLIVFSIILIIVKTKVWIISTIVVLFIIIILTVIPTTIILAVGWGVTCSTINSCLATSVGQMITASAALSGINFIVLVVIGIFIYITTSIMLKVHHKHTLCKFNLSC